MRKVRKLRGLGGRVNRAPALGFLALRAALAGVADGVALPEAVVVPVEGDAPDAGHLLAAEVTALAAFAHGRTLSRRDAKLCYRRDVSTRPPGPRRAPSQVGALVPRVLSDLGLDATAHAVRVLQVWDEALGDLAPHCRPEGIRRGVLVARVPDSAWMARIQLEKPRILAALAAALGKPAATDLRLRIGASERAG